MNAVQETGIVAVEETTQSGMVAVEETTQSGTVAVEGSGEQRQFSSCLVVGVTHRGECHCSKYEDCLYMRS